ncbi:MAG: aldose 1-epimerase [Phreatobacter sp.]|uniref:aldose 1-epimerase n=1 Tax=Phreatobacter sp. TaxID=1966341 RepID=UPI001A4E29BD|nr:aldose 1-epimerase [Phreatobacter sp.]MBL8571854.1 aldose 1-epimerase [Phreatobacter sp.]
MNDTSHPIIALSAGALVLELAPSAGGIIVGFRRGDTLIMRAPDRAAIAAGSPRGGASWPLVPYSNRIRNGRFPWAGRIITLAQDELSRGHAIHGQGWRAPWTAHDVSQSAATLRQVHAADGFWPFDYEARQSFALTPDGFTLWMALTNTGKAPMPAGLGHHPYFHRTADVRLRVATREIWETDAEVLPVRRVPVPPAADLSAGRAVNSIESDHVHVGWKRPAVIEWPSARLALDIDATPIYDRLVVFVPPGEPFFAIEPVSHDTDALNRPQDDTGMRTLAPGETLQGDMRFTVRSL